MVFLLTPYRLFCLHIFLAQLMWPCCFIFSSRYHIVVVFLHFRSPDGSFLTVKTKTGLPTLLKQLAQLHNCHRDTSSPDNNTMWEREPNTGNFTIAVNHLIGLCSWGNRLKGRVMFSVWRGIRAGDGCLRQHCGSETIKVGRKPLSLAAHVWVRAVDPAKPQWLTAQLAVQIISCVSLVCRSFSKSKALLQECRVKNLHEMKDWANKHQCLWGERIQKHMMLRREEYKWVPFGLFCIL